MRLSLFLVNPDTVAGSGKDEKQKVVRRGRNLCEFKEATRYIYMHTHIHTHTSSNGDKIGIHVEASGFPSLIDVLVKVIDWRQGVRCL